MIRVIIIAAAFLSLFLFPYPLTAILSFIASLYFVPLALCIGILADLLYFVPGAAPFGLPVATLLGAALSLLAAFVRRFTRARIIGG